MIYKNFAYIYDSLMYEFSYSDIYKFLLDKFPKSTKVLEIGCGTGELISKLVKNFDVVGLDLSADMLSIAREKLNPDVKLLNLDMRNLIKIDNFDLVISTCDSISYMLTEDDLLKVFKGVFENLNINGYFVFDVNSKYKFLNMENTYIDEINDVFYIWENFYDISTDINLYSVNFFVKNKGESYTRYYEEHKQRAYEDEVIKKLLKSVGFNEVESYNGYTDEKVRKDTERIVYIARR